MPSGLVHLPVVAAPVVVSVNSTGAGNRNTTAGSPISTNFAHTVVAGSNRRMYAFVAVSHANWLNSYTANPSATSDLDGSFTNVSGPIMFGDISGNKQGAVSILELIDPSEGEHTITFSCSASQQLSMIGGNTRCYNNVGSHGTPTTQAQTSSNAALSLSLSSGDNDMAILWMAANGAPTFNGGLSPWHSVGSDVGGDADYLRAIDIDTGGSLTPSTSTSHKLGAIALNLVAA